MRWIKQHIFLSVVNDALIDLAAPINISYLWNFGSILALTLGVQMATGIFLAMHYCPEISLAFSSVEHIMRDVNYGWLLRYLHANGASLFFIAAYIHIGRNIYYGSYTHPRNMVWNIGVVIFILMMATAFLGYVLPWGQMSLWGATVITNFLTAIPYIGQDLVIWVWGGFSVDNATLNRFYSLHYLLPFILAALVFLHIAALHQHGSNNPTGLTSNVDKIRFHPYYSAKDAYGFVLWFWFWALLTFFMPDILGHPDNYIPGNPLVTPPHIVPEWYFLFAYAILRSIPSKFWGVIALFSSLIILFVLPYLQFSNVRSSALRPLSKTLYWFFLGNFLILTWIGGNPVEDPYVTVGQWATLFYFSYFLVLSPAITWLENKLFHFS